MRYMIRKSVVHVYGRIWMPAIEAGTTLTLSDYDVENCREEDGEINRESVEEWLTMHSGDFREVIDFAASIEDGDKTIDIPWASEDNECAWQDCMFPAED